MPLRKICILLLSDEMLSVYLLSSFVLNYCLGFLVAQLVNNLPAMREAWARSLGWEYSLEKRKATHSSILAWRIPRTVKPMVSQRVRQD